MAVSEAAKIPQAAAEPKNSCINMVSLPGTFAERLP